MYRATFSASLSFVSKSSFDADVLLSIHLMISLHVSLMRVRSASGILSLILSSSTVLFTLKQYDSRLFLAVTLSLCCSSSSWYLSASFTIRSMSSLLSRPLSLVIVILFSVFVDLSTAETFKIPLASMSKVTWRRKTKRMKREKIPWR